MTFVEHSPPALAVDAAGADVSAWLTPPQSFTTSDGYELAYRLWRPAGPPRAVVVALHGIQSHSGWYGYSSTRLAEAGYTVAYLDRRGSGMNGAFRGDAPHADRLINDVVQFTQHLSRIGLDGRARILSAVSWGGKLAAAVASQRPELFDGLVLLAPGLCPHVRANAVQRAALRFGNATGAERRAVSIPLNDAELFTDVPAFQAFIRNDPLALRHVTVRFLQASREIDERFRRDVAAVRCPVLLMLAGRDRIVDNLATRRLVASFGSPAICIRSYPEACHTFEFDRQRHVILEDLVEWLRSHS
jgi:acylglycerol lipase